MDPNWVKYQTVSKYTDIYGLGLTLFNILMEEPDVNKVFMRTKKYIENTDEDKINPFAKQWSPKV